MMSKDKMIEDLAKSGLEYQDMLARPIDESVVAACSLQGNSIGYVIPYFDYTGKVLTFYRVKLINNPVVKYMQVKNSSNHVYFPKNFNQVFKDNHQKWVIVTEGEKKATMLCKLGIPAIAFGGVDSWQNRSILIPSASEISRYGGSSSGLLQIKLPSANFNENLTSTMAIGLEDFLDLCLKQGTTLYLCYDTDLESGLANGPQKAASKFGYELRQRGFQLPKIRQLIIPYIGRKTGIDDWLMEKIRDGEKPTEAFMELKAQNDKHPVAFPRHPNIREYVSKMMAKPRMDRKQIQNLVLSLITEFDSRGSRLWSVDDQQMYYFNGQTKVLMKVDLHKPNPGLIQETPFGQMLYKDYNISPAADSKLMQWMGSMFYGEEPLQQVKPHRMIAKHKPGEDIVRFQINNSQYIKVTGDAKKPFTILDNGAEQTLFESELEHGISAELLTTELNKRLREPVIPWWGEVMKEVRVKDPGRSTQLISLLYYLSPFLLRWRGLQLPVEIIVGEAGSGKSTLSEIRLMILNGDPKLRNTPGEYKDWTASIANSGGLHVTDNVHMTDKNLTQKISDDLCRLVTEPDPRISMRKYFTEADERSIAVTSVFGFTAIQQPFKNSDLLQRSMVLELSKAVNMDSEGIPIDVDFDSSWKGKQITRFGGRAAWLSHQMHVLHLFFKKVQEKWDNNYKSKNRLVNLEQSMVLMAEVFGMDSSWIPDQMSGATNNAIEGADWTIEGLAAYASYVRRVILPKSANYRFSASEICTWAASTEDYAECYQMKLPRSLGRWMQSNKHNIATIAGIVEDGNKNNKIVYKVVGS